MKIIDIRGRLFGVINIIDLGVVIILITFGCVFFKLARNAKLGYPMETEIKAVFPSLSSEIIEKLQPGDIGIRHSRGSRLIHFEAREKYYNGSSNVYAWLRLYVRVKDVPLGNRGEKTADYFFNGVELDIYNPIIFTTSRYSIQGTVLNIGQIDREIEVIVGSGDLKEAAEAIKIGDRVSRWGHQVGEVLAKEYTDDGKVKVKLHILRGETELKIGHTFPFETERYYIDSTVVKSIPWRDN